MDIFVLKELGCHVGDRARGLLLLLFTLESFVVQIGCVSAIATTAGLHAAVAAFVVRSHMRLTLVLIFGNLCGICRAAGTGGLAKVTQLHLPIVKVSILTSITLTDRLN